MLGDAAWQVSPIVHWYEGQDTVTSVLGQLLPPAINAKEQGIRTQVDTLGSRTQT